MLKTSLLIALPLVVCSCAAKDEPNVEQPKPIGHQVVPVSHQAVNPPPLEATVNAKPLEAAVAAVQLKQDCPDDAPATTAAAARRALGYWGAPCIQSRIQITFSGDASQKQRVSIAEIRLLSEDGKVLSTLNSRAPSIWNDHGYTPWDEVVDSDKNTQASYKITPPNWRAVERTLGKGSFSATFVIEVDFNHQNKVKTIRSNSFVRSRPRMAPPT